MAKIVTIQLPKKKEFPSMAQVLKEEEDLHNLRIRSNVSNCPLGKKDVTSMPFGRVNTCTLGSHDHCEHKTDLGGMGYCGFAGKSMTEKKME